ncbi:MAG: hypothetical protein IH892_14040, partial [Planctomycetes bacterium]|nr:hypothetical protein [Planctomycetota bacterium]
ADGVPNDRDLCPGTAACATDIDADGCPADGDGDTVADGCDLCPTTANGDPVDPDGCSTADDDLDGVFNDYDVCPFTPDCATNIDRAGCPIDSDGDTLVDGCDQCPGTNHTDDFDGDGVPDCFDPDIDGDGVPNDDDDEPLDEFVCRDADADGVDADDVPVAGATLTVEVSTDPTDPGSVIATFSGTTDAAGVFTGGDPTVWFSNTFTNFGSAVGTANLFDCPAGAEIVLDANGNFTGVPQCIFDAAQAEALANLGPVDAVDPNFKLPSIVRGSIGFTHITDFDGSGFFDDWTINVDIIHTKRRNAVDIIDITLTQVGFAPDGRPIFDRIDPLLAGCNAVFLGPRKGFSIPPGEEAACADPDNDQDTLLTNVAGNKNGGDVTLSIQLNKQFVYELFNKPATFDFSIGYAFTKSKEVNPMGSSTAGSNVEVKVLPSSEVDGIGSLLTLDTPSSAACAMIHTFFILPVPFLDSSLLRLPKSRSLSKTPVDLSSENRGRGDVYKPVPGRNLEVRKARRELFSF